MLTRSKTSKLDTHEVYLNGNYTIFELYDIILEVIQSILGYSSF